MRDSVMMFPGAVFLTFHASATETEVAPSMATYDCRPSLRALRLDPRLCGGARCATHQEAHVREGAIKRRRGRSCGRLFH